MTTKVATVPPPDRTGTKHTHAPYNHKDVSFPQTNTHSPRITTPTRRLYTENLTTYKKTHSHANISRPLSQPQRNPPLLSLFQQVATSSAYTYNYVTCFVTNATPFVTNINNKFTPPNSYITHQTPTLRKCPPGSETRSLITTSPVVHHSTMPTIASKFALLTTQSLRCKPNRTGIRSILPLQNHATASFTKPTNHPTQNTNTTDSTHDR